jgi:hypothetical protein
LSVLDPGGRGGCPPRPPEDGPLEGWPPDKLAVREQVMALGLNSGVFLIRNCQWSLDLMQRLIKIQIHKRRDESLARDCS